ncbi:hypothetical protein [Pinirhizobacter soli]|uniref:hypothetical protein n=1 Tax=Pinirhizobacter soli TaxID=2786953 RepID=UPI00202A94B1|nr:hypothetical protein [Pinirhizobacter soli]
MTKQLPSLTLVRRIKASPAKVFAALTLIHEQLPDEETRKSHEAGWNGLLDKLDVFVGDAA